MNLLMAAGNGSGGGGAPPYSGGTPGTPFKGTVLAADFITGPGLASAVGLTAGTSINTTSGWFKYVTAGGVTMYVATMPFRHTVSWETLNGLGIVTGTKKIFIGGLQYKVRLLTGVTTNPGTTAGGEFNSYMLPMTNGTFATYTTTALGWIPYSGNNLETLCQEVYGGSSHVARGYPDFGGVWYITADTPQPWYGWRPVLELVG